MSRFNKGASSAQHQHLHEHEHEPGDISHIQDKHQHDQGSALETHAHDCCVTTATTAQPEPSAIPLAGATVIRIEQMDCPTEEALVRAAVGRVPTVGAMQFDLMRRTLSVVHEPAQQDAVLSAIRQLGYVPEIGVDLTQTPPPAPKPIWPLGVAGVLALFAEVAHWLSAPEAVAAILALIAIAICGLGTYKKGWMSIRHGLLNINALMSLAVTGAFLLGQWAEAAMVMVLFTVAELIEAKSLDRARRALSGLMDLAPDDVLVRQPDGAWSRVLAQTVVVGDVVQAKPGERIGLDGQVLSGQSTVDQAPITGESMPVDKKPGDPLYAGTINGQGMLEYSVTAVSTQSTLARIVQIVEQAQEARAPTQRFVDKFARIYTPIVIVLAVGIAIAGPLLTGEAWSDWIYKALVLLVIACPCALVISTPVTVVSGLTRAARLGILVKGGIYLEMGRTLHRIALDKTGTLTAGRPVLTDARSFVVDATTTQAYAVALARGSDHPVSQAIARAGQTELLSIPVVMAFEAVAGQGIRGQIDGALFSLGNLRMAQAAGLSDVQVIADMQAWERTGKTVVALMRGNVLYGLFAVADSLKAESREAVAALAAMGVSCTMLTGDNAHTAQAIADQAGISDVRSEQLPEDKMAAIAALRDRGPVGMVGDGINDAPALARADIGFAMGVMGSDTAMETADVAIMDDDLRKVATFIRLSRRTHRILMQNIVLALGIKAVFLALTVAGVGSMWMAVFADVGASLLVVANGLRLMRA